MSPASGGPTGRPDAAPDAEAPELLRRLLAGRRPRQVADAAVDRRAAVVLLLRSEERPAPGSDAPADRGPLAPPLAGLEALFVLRAEREGDPWSGHVGLPGGHREPGDPDLPAAARREVAEEVGLTLDPSAMLGRLDDVHPRSRRLPSVAVTPYVAWTSGGEVRHGVEVEGHLWVPLAELEAPGRRSVLTFRRDGALRAFPAIEVGGLTIWGLTFAIVRRFLDELPRRPEGGRAP